MKKFLLILLILSNMTCFASTYKYYKKATLEQCVAKLNELKINYKIIDYRMFQTSWDDVYNMVIEVEEK